jgi:hypothetical protein
MLMDHRLQPIEEEVDLEILRFLKVGLLEVEEVRKRLEVV